MSLKKILLVAVTSLIVYGGTAIPCQAQNSLNRRRPLRWLGQGYSDGYHRQNPGHDTSYYSPYTAHNSTLVSQSPEYQMLLAQQASQQPHQRFFAGVPFSVYAAPNQLTPGFHSLPGQQVQGTFSPSVGSGLLDSGEDQASDNAFEPSDDNESNSKVEDDLGDSNDGNFRDNDDSDFREDDSNFREDDDADFREESMDKNEPMKEMEFEHDAEDANVDTDDDLGGLPGLNDGLSFDFE